jgi:hypothetical protein
MPMPMPMPMMLMVMVSDVRCWVLLLLFCKYAFLEKTVSLNRVIQSISVETTILVLRPPAQGTT